MRFEPQSHAGPVSAFVEDAETALRQGFHGLGVGSEPVAILLSGGIDSSVLAAIAREECQEVLGIVGRLPGSANVETRRALVVGEALGIETMVVDVETGLFLQDFPSMVARIGQPPRNPNNLVLQQLLRAIPDGIQFVLNGDGAEMMFGLADVKRVDQFASKRTIARRFFPEWPATFIGKMLRRGDSSLLWRAARLLDHSPRDFAAALDVIHYSPSLRRALEPWAGSPFDFIPISGVLSDESRPFSDRLQEYQTYTFLQSSLIRHDRLSVPLGLEPVFPFLSGPVVDFCLGLPQELRFLGQSKPLLRFLCDRHLPEKVARWPKLGFPVPWENWLDGPLKPFRASLRSQLTFDSPFPLSLFEMAESEGDHEAIWTFLTLEMTRKMFEEAPTES